MSNNHSKLYEAGNIELLKWAGKTFIMLPFLMAYVTVLIISDWLYRKLSSDVSEND